MMKYLKWLGTGLLFFGVEIGLLSLIFKTHYGPYIFLTLLGLAGAFAVGMAFHQGK